MDVRTYMRMRVHTHTHTKCTCIYIFKKVHAFICTKTSADIRGLHGQLITKENSRTHPEIKKGYILETIFIETATKDYPNHSQSAKEDIKSKTRVDHRYMK